MNDFTKFPGAIPGPIPRISITLERMQHQISCAVSEHLVREMEDVQIGIEQAFKAFDVKAYVEQLAHDALEKELADSTKWIVREALNAPSGEAHFRSKLRKIVVDALDAWVEAKH